MTLLTGLFFGKDFSGSRVEKDGIATAFGCTIEVTDMVQEQARLAQMQSVLLPLSLPELAVSHMQARAKTVEQGAPLQLVDWIGSKDGTPSVVRIGMIRDSQKRLAVMILGTAETVRAIENAVGRDCRVK